MTVTEQEMETIRQAYRQDNAFWSLLSPQTRQILDLMIDLSDFAGVTDTTALHALATMVTLIKPKRVLQLGTHIGFSAIMVADIVKQFHDDGQVITVDPSLHYHAIAREWTEKANLDQCITFLDGYSTDTAIIDQLNSAEPFDLIYLDSSHMYAPTLDELKLVLADNGWLSPHGLLMLHDAAAFAQRFDPTNEGGVYRALNEWIDTYPHLYHLLILEPPLWPCGCGLGLITRRSQRASAPVDHSIYVSKINQLEALLQTKNSHILGLEKLIRRLENGRIMRLLGWLRR